MAVHTLETDALTIQLDERSVALRHRLIDVLERSGQGHFGPTASIFEIIRVLYDDVLKYDPKVPNWSERDRFILSKGHGCLSLFILLAEKGFFPSSELDRFCEDGALLGGHPVYGIPGVEASTGSLGHGLSVGIGMALSLRHDRNPARVVVLVGNGECNEGSIWEAAMSASKHGLENLTVIVDYNRQQCSGASSEILDLEPFADKWRAFGFAVEEINGHDVYGLKNTLTGIPLECGKPSAVICNTVKGKGVPSVEGHPLWHYKSAYREEDIQLLRSELEGKL